MDARITRRRFHQQSLALGLASLGSAELGDRCRAAEPGTSSPGASPAASPALVAITLDLEMSRHYPTWDQTHWDYEKGNLDQPTKEYTLEACRRVKKAGGVIHCFAVGRVLEQENVDWLKAIADEGHRVGNHTYDHVNLLATEPAELQFRFQRAPWLIRGKRPRDVIVENIAMTTDALKERVGIRAAGFRTPGGFAEGLKGRPDLQTMLLEQGFSWVSSLYPAHPRTKPHVPPTEMELDQIVAAQEAAQPFRYPTGLIEVPMSPVSDVNAFRTMRWPLSAFKESTRRALDWVIAHGKTFDFLAHPSCLVVADPDFETIDMICAQVRAVGDRARIVPLDDLAARLPVNPESKENAG